MRITALLSGLLFATACTEKATDCKENADCGAGFECRLGACRVPPLTEADAGSQKDAGQARLDGGLSCATPGSCLLGETCSTNAECKSQFCADGVCCNEQCGGGCGLCNAIGSAGTCKPREKATACGAYACTGTSTVCPSTCSNVDGCEYAYACCVPNNPAYGDCAAQNLEGKCFKQPACSSLTETFAQGALDGGKWETFSNDQTTITVIDQRLTFELNKSGSLQSGYSLAKLRPRCSLVGSSYSVEIGSALGIRQEGNRYSSINVDVEPENGQLGGVYVSIVDSASVPELYLEGRIGSGNPDAGTTYLTGPVYSPAQHRFFRINEDAGVVSFGVSADGRQYSTIAQGAPAIRLSDVVTYVSVYRESQIRDAGTTIAFDNFNVVP